MTTETRAVWAMEKGWTPLALLFLALAVASLVFVVGGGNAGHQLLGIELSCVTAAIGIALFPGRKAPDETATKAWWSPLVVLVPSLATVIGSVAVLVLTRGAWETTIHVILAGLALTERVGSRIYGTKTALRTAVLTVAAGFLGLALLALFAIASALGCETEITGSWLAVAVACGAAVYLTLGTLAFRAKHVTLGLLPSLIVAVITMGIVLAAAPVHQIPDCST
jgi:hypothetical protein